MIGERRLVGEEEEELPKSRRELRKERRRERRKKLRATLALSLGLRRRSTPDYPAERSPEETDPEEEELPKSRRELRQKRRRKGMRGGFTEFAITIAVSFVLVFGVVRPFVAQAFRIPSESMVPTLEVGDRVLANKFVYYFQEPQRGEIVVFDGVPGEEDETLIKRVVGVGGDRIRVREGRLLVNGEEQDEPYVNREGPQLLDTYSTVRVPRGQVFLMGDNRSNSADSRVFGTMPVEDIKGEAFMRFWPISRIGPL